MYLRVKFVVEFKAFANVTNHSANNISTIICNNCFNKTRTIWQVDPLKVIFKVLKEFSGKTSRWRYDVGLITFLTISRYSG